MIAYCIIYPILTFGLFLLWYLSTPLTGESIGMAPILLALVLFAVFVIEISVVLILRTRISSMRSKVISLFVAFLLYETTLWFFSGNISLLDVFQNTLLENRNMAFSFSSILALLLILGLMWINQRVRQNKRLHSKGVFE